MLTKTGSGIADVFSDTFPFCEIKEIKRPASVCVKRL